MDDDRLAELVKRNKRARVTMGIVALLAAIPMTILIPAGGIGLAVIGILVLAGVF